jgi:hypothetical protein
MRRVLSPSSLLWVGQNTVAFRSVVVLATTTIMMMMMVVMS